MSTPIARLSILTALIMAAPSGEGSVLVSPDIAIRDTGKALQLFVADPVRGRLLFGEVPREARSVPVPSLSPTTPCGPFEGAVAVAVRGSRLIAVKGEPGPLVFECDLEARKGGVLFSGELLRSPASVAIDADGSVGVLDRALRGVVVLRREARPTVVRVSPSPMVLRADDLGQLYVVDYEIRGIVPVSLRESKGSSSIYASAPYEQKRGSAFLSLAVEPAAFAVFRDVFYVAETTGPLRVQLAGGRVSIEVPDARPRQAAVAVSRDHLATIDREAASVDVIERPLPAGLVIDPTRGNPNEAWTQLLEYIAERRLLPRDRVRVLPEDATYEALLSRTGVLLKSDVNPKSVALEPGRAKRLFCQLNPTVCDTGYNLQLPGAVIPQASPQPVLQTTTTVLNGKDVRNWVDEYVLLASHKKEVTDGYLTTRNPSAAGATLENELLRRKMVMATPMHEGLVAGSLIRIEKSRENVIGTISSICDGLTPATAKTSLLSRLTAPRSLLPGTDARATDRAQMDVGAWLRSTISTASLEKCRPAETPPDTYVITESLAVNATSFSPLTPEKGGEGIRTFPDTFFVGYKVVPISGLAAGVALPADPERLKPAPDSAPNQIWRLSSGSLTLPVTRWRTDVLLPSADFYNAEGPLQKLLAENPSLDLSPRERLDRAAFSTSIHTIAQPNADELKEIEAAHANLVKTIKYDEQLALAAGAEDVYIGIVEDSRSVNRDHPGFIADNQSAWYEFVNATGLLQPYPAPSDAGDAADAASR
jgi:hypothetical protein